MARREYSCNETELAHLSGVMGELTLIPTLIKRPAASQLQSDLRVVLHYSDSFKRRLAKPPADRVDYDVACAFRATASCLSNLTRPTACGTWKFEFTKQKSSGSVRP